MRRSINRIAVCAFGLTVLVAVLLGCTMGRQGQPAAQQPTPAPAIRPTPTAPASEPDTGAGAGPPRAPATNTVLSPFVTDDFLGAGYCELCHANLRDASGTDVSMPDHWRSSMMANAGRDPFWQAKLSSEVARLPALAATIEEECTLCHMPMANTQAVVNGEPVTAMGAGFFSSDHGLHAAAVDGVACTLCHQVQDVGLGEMTSFSGHYTIDATTDPPNRPIFGPYQQPIGRPMQMHTGYIPAYGEHMLSAEHCATCHNLYTPSVDAEGAVLGEFPEQTPYTEWLHSRFGAAETSCQTCHMPLAQGGVVISPMPGNLAPREPFFQHHFVGGNALMLRILRDWGAELEAGADPAHFEATLARVTDQVAGRAATLTLQNLGLAEGQLVAELAVAPLTGHKFPTSFPSRRVWLHVTVTGAAGQTIFESGRPNADGSIAGADADADAAAYEPHYDVISQPDQVQIYEPIMGDNEGAVTYTLLRGAVYLKDNRLLPQGADKAALPADIGVAGGARDDANFVGGGDRVTYRVNIDGATGPFTLEAELLYDPLAFRFVQDMLQDQTALTERFAGYYAATDKTPLRVAAIEPITIE